MNARYLPRRAQGDPDNLAGEMDTLGASDHNEDGICVPKKLLNVSELGIITGRGNPLGSGWGYG